jgi:hypothetical protein
VLVNGVMPTTTGHLFLAADAACCLAAGIFIFHRLRERAPEYL